MKLLVDTWGWLNLRDRREMYHQKVTEFYRNFRAQGGEVYTTDYILDETFTLLFKRLPFEQARESVRLVDEAIASGYLILEWMIPERFANTKTLRLKFQDKPNISFTDLFSMVLIEELNIPFVLTGDAHFTHTGLAVQVVPRLN